MAFTLDAGKTENLAIEYLDANGSPMLVAPKPDSLLGGQLNPAWGQTNPAAETLTPSADGNTATAVGLALGTDTVEVDLTVGGIAFRATVDATITGPPAQVLTSIAIVATPA